MSDSAIEWTEKARETDMAYLAGIVDADGYVTASMTTRKGRTYFAAQVGVTGSCREPHDLAAELFGGNVSAHRPTGGREHHKLQFHWQLSGRGAVPVITALLPFLRVKQLRAQLVLELQNTVNEYRACRYLFGDSAPPWMPAGWDPTPGLRSQVEEIRGSVGRIPTWEYPARVPVGPS